MSNAVSNGSRKLSGSVLYLTVGGIGFAKGEDICSGGRRLAVDMRLRQFMELLLTERDAKNGG